MKALKGNDINIEIFEYLYEINLFERKKLFFFNLIGLSLTCNVGNGFNKCPFGEFILFSVY